MTMGERTSDMPRDGLVLARQGQREETLADPRLGGPHPSSKPGLRARSRGEAVNLGLYGSVIALDRGLPQSGMLL
jgi:hypothetical protein